MVASLSLAEIPTLSLLYRLSKLSAPSTALVKTASPRYNSLVSLIRTDITKLQVGAIVNAANNSLLGGGGVDGAIHRGAGPGLLRECRGLDGCDTGSAKITGAYELPCDKVIHAVGPIYHREDDPAALLKGCYRTSLDLAVKNGCRSIAFSALSTGVYGYPSGEAAEAAIAEVRKWIDEHDAEGSVGGLERIVFCCFEMKDVVAYEKWLPQFFPPTDEDIPQAQSTMADEAEELQKAMPDPPSTEPLTPGEPATKKQKVVQPKDVSTNAEKDDDWEIVNVDSTKKQPQAELETEKESSDDAPQNLLAKDW